MDNDVIYNPDIHHRKSIRLDGYDYSDAGAYFISVVAQGRLCLFGSVVDGELRPERGREDGPPGLGRDAGQVSIDQYGRIRGDAQPCTWRHFHPPTSANDGGNVAGARRGEGTHKGGEGTYVGGGGWCVQICDHGGIC